jgi:hypothetical protein
MWKKIIILICISLLISCNNENEDQVIVQFDKDNFLKIGDEFHKFDGGSFQNYGLDVGLYDYGWEGYLQELNVTSFYGQKNENSLTIRFLLFTTEDSTFDNGIYILNSYSGEGGKQFKIMDWTAGYWNNINNSKGQYDIEELVSGTLRINLISDGIYSLKFEGIDGVANDVSFVYNGELFDYGNAISSFKSNKLYHLK